jgi:hypothetical protein
MAVCTVAEASEARLRVVTVPSLDMSVLQGCIDVAVVHVAR